MLESKLAWYALRVRSRHEQVTAAGLAYKGYEHFVPSYKERRQRSDRYQTVDVPLFPGYVFCRFDVHDRLPAVTVPGLVNRCN
jgi:transcription antitermination factor NusG